MKISIFINNKMKYKDKQLIQNFTARKMDRLNIYNDTKTKKYYSCKIR